MNRSIWILPGISGFSIQMVSAQSEQIVSLQKSCYFAEFATVGIRSINSVTYTEPGHRALLEHSPEYWQESFVLSTLHHYYFTHPPSSLSAMLLLRTLSKTTARWPTVALLPFCCFHEIKSAFALSRLLLYSSSILWIFDAEMSNLRPITGFHYFWKFQSTHLIRLSQFV